MSALLRRLGRPGRLHVPSFFCMGVAEALGKDMPLAWYRHLPDGRGPRWETLRADPGDVVLAQNLFGREDGAAWREWIAAHPDVTVLEDHSHDPFGPWAESSTAAYAVASLRKTLPVPDGAVLWSPQGLEVPVPSGPANEGSHLKLAAMLLKAAWLDGYPIPKEKFRALQQQGEQTLLGSDAPPSAFTAAVLPLLDIAGIRAAGTRNVRALETLLHASLDSSPDVLCATLSGRGGAPFRVQVFCDSESERDRLLARLAAGGIFAPVHWRQDREAFWSGDDEAAAWAGRILTLPVDHRCGAGEVHRMVEAVSDAVRAGV
ncbi:hypothetical protein OWR29_30655 [Actinoplanes sp. Pm04-4]|uniref:Uncharacterized protein n=1 Tax=Paractinoplanes pyxinae TaxID=2997416 RepID=A0ABT4B9T6_9ACTN|nr:hypothetical protein [Actinoplanes pyxinae]MCY1142380.1 hypothetical protein [Actinoplanes pyxinae]